MSNASLRVRGLSRSFGGLRAANDVSFDVVRGTITALIGPNGAGKTTLFNLITNLFSADTGEIEFEGRRIDKMQPGRIADLGLIRTFQTARVFPGMTVLENVMVGRSRISKCGLLQQALWSSDCRRAERDLTQRADALLALTGLTRFRDTHAVELPMGAQKMLEILRALMAQPKLLLLDEPAAGLNDTETSELASLMFAIRASDITVLIVEHNMGLVMGVADRVVVLETGAVIATGTPAEIQTNDRVIKAYLG
ncbi:MAG: ABC transporter ATP-binding protein [Bordetella sp.]|uniref:ABC transporter ATP-binding protein n=1 Tax=Bordetella sp. TaxID=28081 RepID=UPI003F7B82FB